MESIGDARSFLSAAREVALTKPIIVIKAGRTAAGGKAAASHTGSLTGSDDVLDAAFRRSGVLRVNTISDLFYMAEVLAKQPRPKGPRLTILTNAGGPGVLATDALITSGGELAEISAGDDGRSERSSCPQPGATTTRSTSSATPTPERYAKALEIAAKDPNSDGLLVILTPQAMTDPTQTAEHLKPYAKLGDKPVLASWMGGPTVAAGERILNGANIPTFPYPDTAARMFDYMWRYSYNLRGLYETPDVPQDRRGRRQPRPGRADHPEGARRGPHHPDRVRIQAGAGGLRHSDRAHRDRPHRGRSRPGRREDRLPGRAQALLGDHHPQDRCRRRAAQPGRCGRGPRRLERHPDRGHREGRRRAFPWASPCSR